MDHLTSFQNPVVKHIKKLGKMKKIRDLHGQAVLEGYRLIKDSLDAGVKFKYVLMEDDFLAQGDGQKLYQDIKPRTEYFYTTTKDVINDISTEKSPQSVLAVCYYPRISFTGIMENCPSFILILDEVQDPGNAGTLIRTAAATGVDAVVLTTGSVDIYNPKVLRASMGAIFRIPVVPSVPADNMLEKTKAHKMEIITADNKGTFPYYRGEFAKKIALVIGNEGRGVSDMINEACHMKVKIPMERHVESLNAAIAGGVIMYEIYRQRHKEQ